MLLNFTKINILTVVFLIFTLLVVSCKDKKEQVLTYFGGQIINPKSDKVFLYKGKKLLDSAILNKNFKFLMPLDSMAMGLYIFKHGLEMQYMYLEPSDSLLIRLNTWDFDESLVYSGKGAERNNFLINLFLENEKEDKLFFDFYQLTDSLFEQKIDSVIQRKKIAFSQLKEEILESSPLFEKLAETAIYFPLYRKKEAYSFRHKRAMKLKDFPKVAKSFYQFREDININDKELAYFYAYHDYVRTYLYHLAYEKQIIDSFSCSIKVNFMQAALENIKDNVVKNDFLHEGIWYVLLDDSVSDKDKNTAKRLFFDHCSDEKSVDKISHLINVAERLPIGHEFPNLKVYNVVNEKLDLTSISLGKNTVIYTWPTKENQIEFMAKRVNYLQKVYPEYLFVGLDSKNSQHSWKELIKSKKMNPTHQYRMDKDNDWLDVPFSRAIIIDKNGLVQNSLTHLSSSNFEKHLKKLFSVKK